MNLFETAYAADAGAPPGSEWSTLLFMGVFVLIFYFMLWRPQSKRRKEHQALMSGLERGDEIVTAGGMVGVINKVENGFVKVQIAPNVEIRLQKTAIGATLPKGTIKSLEES
jgi:preprotein translocase subunit YajC